jgi:alpha/beta superfamily hydrolase
MMTFSGEPPDACRLDLFVGDRDDFAPADIVRNWAASLEPPGTVHAIAGADHFFAGALAPLTDAVADALG